jgi:glycerol-3-phosphate dehydrogenase
MYSQALSPTARDRALAALSSGDELDVIVIGGGVVGAGCALDAVTRGLSVGLLEGNDWASGTSSRSSKLIHGGLRYLEMLDFGLVREALRERGLIIQRLAPHLTRPVSFLYPLRHRGWERLYAGTGVLLYDTLGAATGHSRGVPHHRHLTRRGALRACPALRPDSMVVPCSTETLDDAGTMFLRTAASYGAHVASGPRSSACARGRAAGRREGQDLETEREFEVGPDN